MPAPFTTPVARSTPFDNATNGFISTDVQGAIEEVQTSASPGYSFGRSGVTTGGAYLQTQTVPSNVSGMWVYINNAVIAKIFVTNELTATYSIDILYHDGNEVNLTLVGTVTVTAAKGAFFTVNWSIPTNKQLAVRISPTSASNPKNILCGLELKGTVA